MLSDPEFAALLERMELSWDGYHKVRRGVKKRLRRRAGELGCKRFRDYLELLERDPALRAECRLLLTVSVSRFLRDAALWQALQDELLPALAWRGRPRVWSAGCALGQEPYGMLMTYHELRRADPGLPWLELMATDLNPAYLARAQAGVFARGALRRLPPGWQERYFAKVPGVKQYRIRQELRRGVTWQQHDLLRDPPPGRFGLIMLRNSVFTYEQEPAQGRALRLVLGALEPGGWLVIGRKESLPPGEWSLAPAARLAHVFEKPSA